MSTDDDILLLDSLSSRVLNDFRDEVAKLIIYTTNTNLKFILPDILKRLHFQQRPDISQP